MLEFFKRSGAVIIEVKEVPCFTTEEKQQIRERSRKFIDLFYKEMQSPREGKNHEIEQCAWVMAALSMGASLFNILRHDGYIHGTKQDDPEDMLRMLKEDIEDGLNVFKDKPSKL